MYEKKTYTYDDFKVNTYAYKPITETGRRNRYTGKYEINYSFILTRLIQEAGRYCERFASDLFIDWEGVEHFLEYAEPGDSKTLLFGFRQDGVDHDTFVFSRYENEGSYAKFNYRSMWRLDMTTTPLSEDDRIEMTLGRVF